MPHALIPDGFTLKKVTKSEERAVNNKRRHDNVQTLLENPATIPVVASSIGLVVAGTLIDRFVDNLDINVPESALEKAKEATVSAAFAITPQNLILESGLLGFKAAGVSKERRDELEKQIRDLIPGL